MAEDKRRAVHAMGAGLRIVRYEAGGKWFVEGRYGGYRAFDTFVIDLDDGKPVHERFTNNIRKRVSVEQAASCAVANEMEWIRGVPGGREFDRLVAPHELVVLGEEDEDE